MLREMLSIIMVVHILQLQQFLRVEVREATLPPLAQPARGAHSIDDIGFCHSCSFISDRQGDGGFFFAFAREAT